MSILSIFVLGGIIGFAISLIIFYRWDIMIWIIIACMKIFRGKDYANRVIEKTNKEVGIDLIKKIK